MTGKNKKTYISIEDLEERRLNYIKERRENLMYTIRDVAFEGSSTVDKHGFYKTNYTKRNAKKYFQALQQVLKIVNGRDDMETPYDAILEKGQYDPHPF